MEYDTECCKYNNIQCDSAADTHMHMGMQMEMKTCTEYSTSMIHTIRIKYYGIWIMDNLQYIALRLFPFSTFYLRI